LGHKSVLSMPPRRDTSEPSLFAIGFGLTLGSIAATIIFIAIGLLLFIPGFLIVKKEQKKPGDQQSMGLKVMGYILMILGCIVALGLGFGMLLGLLAEEI
jgi:hypothetical protein